MIRILYIGGYGRSGSTLLAAVLGHHPEVISPGEIGFLPEEWNRPDRPCACGAPYTACEFWGPLFRDGGPGTAEAEAVRATDRLSRYWRSLLPVGGGRRVRLYRDFHARLFDHVRAESRRSWIVDSSKSARWAFGRAVALRRVCGADVRLLHLVRDGRGVLRSHVDVGGNWALEGRDRPRRLAAARAVLGWTWTNAAAATLLRWRLGPERYLRLRLEDFLSEPAASLERIGRFTELDMGPVVSRLRMDGFEVGHMVGGNRLRFDGRVRLRPPAVPSSDRPARLRHRVLFSVFGGWLNRRFGYAERRRVPSRGAERPESGTDAIPSRQVAP